MARFMADLALHSCDFKLRRDERGEVFIILCDDDEWFLCLIHLVRV